MLKAVRDDGLNPKEIPATKIPRQFFKDVIVRGLSEQVWGKEDSVSSSQLHWNFENCTLLLPIPVDSVDWQQLDQKAHEHGFARKNELHVTIVGFKNGREIKERIQGQEDLKVQLNELLKTISWDYVLRDEVYEVSKTYPNGDVRSTYVQLVSLEGIKEFYQKLSQLLGKNFAVPPMHITLYTKGNPMGIGIDSENELNNLIVQKL